ncbi:MAG: MerR family transcriptional regulator [Desulfovibrionaceae bacterium]
MSERGDNGTWKIGQAAKLLDLKTYVLRFWESEFPQLEPLRTSSGQRLYTREHIDLLQRIKRLLYDEGLTIEGARRRIEEEGQDRLREDIVRELNEIKRLLE